MSRSQDLASDASSRASDPDPARDALVVKFTKILPGWLRKYGVQQANLADAVQEALEAALVKVREGNDGVPLDDTGVRRELMRIVSTVAQRTRRQVQRANERYTSLEDGDVSDLGGLRSLRSGRDEEEWIESRVLVLEALENLDEPTRALIFAHEVEGRTNVEIAATLKIKEDAVEKRVIFARQRLRSEVEHLERGRIRRPRHGSMLSLGLGLDDFDRAAFGAFYEATGKIPTLSAWPKLQSFFRPNLPTAALAGALALAPNSSPTDEITSRQEKHISFVDLSGIDISSVRAVPITFIAQGCASRPLAEPDTPSKAAVPQDDGNAPLTDEQKHLMECVTPRAFVRCPNGPDGTMTDCPIYLPRSECPERHW